MAKPVILSNGKQWPTKKAATAHFSSMLARYKNGERIAPDDAADLAALLKRYDQCLQPGQVPKIGAGISHFTREINLGPTFATAGFHVHRIDNTSDDFSFWDAVKFEPK